MTDLDEEIRKTLEASGLENGEAKFREPGLFAMLGGVLTGRMRHWSVFMGVLAFVFFIAAVWMDWQFMRTENSKMLALYGFGTIAAMLAVAMLKLWRFMEMNRYAITREIKRVQLQLAALAERLE